MRIEVNNLYFSYPNGVEALSGVSLAIEAGEQVAIVGQNGAGKTTLVRHFNGLLKPSRGIVTVGEKPTISLQVSDLARFIGYVFQNPDDQLFCRTIRDEVRFGPQNLGFDQDRIEKLAGWALDLTELTGKEHQNPYDLSPTWRKMVTMASILTMDTPVVILDEPTTGQDAVSILKIAKIIVELHKAQKTVIAITHDIDFCAENFERMVVMGQGRVLIDGPIRQVLAQEEILSSTYVDPPQLTRLGNRLGFADPVCTPAEFLDTLRVIR